MSLTLLLCRLFGHQRQYAYTRANVRAEKLIEVVTTGQKVLGASYIAELIVKM